jgi:glutamate-1-semialdehyde aminotransferase
MTGVPPRISSILAVARSGMDDTARRNAQKNGVIVSGMSEPIEMVRRGVFVNPGAKWYVSAAHTDDDLEATAGAFEEALRTVRDSGVLDG